MRAEQGVLGIPVMIEQEGFPVLLAVTFFAVLPKVGPMNVILLMAAVAVSRRLVFIQRPLVTTLAFYLPMVALQNIFRISIMIEEHRLPVTFGVAADAFLAEASLVCVVFLVTGKTIYRSFILIEVSLVTGFTLRPKMAPKQRVFCVQPMVKDDGLPVAFCMAGLALLSVAPLMLVVLLVAGVALHRSIFERRRRVTFLALNRFMLSN